MALNPTIAALFEQFKAAGRPAISAGDVAAARKLMTDGRAALGAGPDLPRVEELTIPTRAGPMAARLLSPGEPDGLVVYLHGGGWVIGAVDDFDAVARLFAAESGCAFLLPEYRLAPEAPWPGPVEDAVDAVAWAGENAARLLGRPAPLAVAGDSAGGNLAAVAALELRGRVSLALQALIYPVTDHDFETASYLDAANAGILTRADMIWFFDRYAPVGSRSDATISPLRAPDLSGLPPAYVATAEHDVLRDEGEAYAERLRKAGVPTTLRRFDGMPHGFIRLFNHVSAVRAADAEIARVIGDACRAAGRG